MAEACERLGARGGAGAQAGAHNAGPHTRATGTNQGRSSGCRGKRNAKEERNAACTRRRRGGLAFAAISHRRACGERPGEWAAAGQPGKAPPD